MYIATGVLFYKTPKIKCEAFSTLYGYWSFLPKTPKIKCEALLHPIYLLEFYSIKLPRLNAQHLIPFHHKPIKLILHVLRLKDLINTV